MMRIGRTELIVDQERYRAFVAEGSDCFLHKLVFQTIGDNPGAIGVKIFTLDLSGNYSIINEVTLPITAADATAGLPPVECVLDIGLPQGWAVLVELKDTPGDGYYVTSYGETLEPGALVYSAGWIAGGGA